VAAVGSPGDRVDLVSEQQQEADVQRARDLARKRREGSDHKLVSGESQRRSRHYIRRDTRELALDAGLVKRGLRRLRIDMRYFGRRHHRHSPAPLGRWRVPRRVT
jgi:hypothetical protein